MALRASLLAVSAHAVAGAAFGLSAPPSAASVLADIDLADAYFRAHNPPGDCGWTRGTYYAGAISHYHATCGGASGCDASLLNFISGWAESHKYACAGSINANDEACGQTYTELYELSPSSDKLALSATLEEQIHSNSTKDWNWVE